MAVGFRLSEVLNMAMDDEEPSAILFTTRAIKYKIIFDDPDKRLEIIEMLRAIKEAEVKKEKKIDRPKFYLEDDEGR